METDSPLTMTEQLAVAWAQVQNFFLSLTQPGWRLYQVLIVLGLIAAAWCLKAIVGPWFYAWIRSLAGRPKWQLRFLVTVHQRLWLIFFVLLAWPVFWTMQELTWPSRSYLVGVAGTIALVMLVIQFAVRLIRNRFLQRIVTWGLSLYAVLYFTGLMPTVTLFLEELAVSFGDFRLSALTVVKALIVVTVLFTVARFVSHSTASQVQRNEDISPSMRVLIVKVLQIALYGAAFFIGLKSVGFDLTGLAIFSGAVGVGIGFGLQKIVSNLISGFIILLDKSIKPGDVISLGETFGWINTLGARYTSITTRDGREYLVPNEDLITNQVVNWSHSDSFVRLDLHFGVSYGDNPHEIRAMAIAAAGGVDRVLKHKPPVCHITGFGDSSVDYILRFWITDPVDGLTNIRGKVYLALWDAFKDNGVSIPFPQREVRMLGEEDASAEKVSAEVK